MERFHIIEEGAAIICQRGIFKQVKIYRRDKDIYAGCGTGFIKLYGSMGTSAPRISWLSMEGEGVIQEAGKAPKWNAPLAVTTHVVKVIEAHLGVEVKKNLTRGKKDGDTVRKPRNRKEHTGLKKQVS